MKPFLGTFFNKVDGKGRVSVPARWRGVFEGSDYQGVVCFPSVTTGAIEGVTMKRMEELAAMIDTAFDPLADTNAAFATSILADSFELPFDGDGRIILPEALLAHAEIEDIAVFTGMGSRFMIWEPEAYKRIHDELREAARANRDEFNTRWREHVGRGRGGAGAKP